MEIAHFQDGEFVVKMPDKEFGNLLLQTAISVILQVHGFEKKPEENYLGWDIEDRIRLIESQVTLLFESAEASKNCEYLETWQLTTITDALTAYQAWRTNYLISLDDEKVRAHFYHEVFGLSEWENHNLIIRREI